MKKLALLMTTMLSTAAIAGGEPELNDIDKTGLKTGYYTSVSGGLNFLSDADVGGLPSKYDATIDFDTGSVFTLAVGKEFGDNIRGEIELGRQQNDFKANVTKSYKKHSHTYTVPGENHTYTLMVNGYYDFTDITDYPVTPYVGAGVGLAEHHIKANYHGLPLGDNDVTFAYQGIAGLSHEVNPDWDVFAEYRYFATTDPEFAYGIDTEYNSQQAKIGVRYNF